MKKTNKKESLLNKIKILSFNRKIRLLLIILLPVVIAASACFLFFTINNKYVEQKYDAYKYSHNAKINYGVSLLPNNLYTQKNLGEGGIYITELVDSINPKMKYEFSGNQQANIQGKYSITALFEGFIKNDKDKALWKRKTILQPEKSFSVNDKKILLASSCNLSLKNYNEMVKNINDLYKFNCTSRLTIIWSITVNANTKSGIVNETLDAAMEIPVNEKYFEIGGNLNNDKKGQITLTRKVLSPYYNEKITTAIIAGVICFLMMIFIIFFTAALPEIDELEKKTRQIFNNYADRLVGINSDMSSVQKEVINVSAIEDLVRIADELGKPILYKTDDKEINNYLVLDNSTIYMLDIRESLLNIPFQESKLTNPIKAHANYINEQSFEE